MRGLAYKRFQREKHIQKKENILRTYCSDNPPHKYNDKHLFNYIIFPRNDFSEGNWISYCPVKTRGQLNKNKVHCSSGICIAKTRNKGKKRHVHGNYAPSLNYKISDLRKVQQMTWDESDWHNEDELPFNLYDNVLDGELEYSISDEEFNEIMALLFNMK